MRALLLLIAALCILSACAENRPAASRASAMNDCFRADMVSSFTPVDDRLVDIRVNRRRQYRLELAGYCPDVDWSQRIALRTRGGGAFICRGMDAEIIVPDHLAGAQRCLVTRVRRLTPAEIESLKRG